MYFLDYYEMIIASFVFLKREKNLTSLYLIRYKLVRYSFQIIAILT